MLKQRTFSLADGILVIVQSTDPKKSHIDFVIGDSEKDRELIASKMDALELSPNWQCVGAGVHTVETLHNEGQTWLTVARDNSVRYIGPFHDTDAATTYHAEHFGEDDDPRWNVVTIDGHRDTNTGPLKIYTDGMVAYVDYLQRQILGS